ncbi:hypothetical protein SEEERB17_002128 [Salmonella enterica subsp. enterica serovar Enteritidis str. SARB17]|nr:hypothetical protein SEEERB17_002128 [Salmonella enterica subsp. enterica serovar Enteritidis str. SARB17]
MKTGFRLQCGIMVLMGLFLIIIFLQTVLCLNKVLQIVIIVCTALPDSILVHGDYVLIINIICTSQIMKDIRR